MSYYLSLILHYAIILTYEEEVAIVFLVLKLSHKIMFIYRQMRKDEKKITQSPLQLNLPKKKNMHTYIFFHFHGFPKINLFYYIWYQ